ncbi:MAG: hypothetical protein H8K05_03070 [Nitrospira sp.]|nr:hypothetical protein [Nitrospira sp.]
MTTLKPNLEKLSDQRHALLFGIRRSARYHLRRRGFFELWHATTNFIGIASGSAAVVAVVKDFPTVAASLAVLVALASAFDLVIGTAEMARKHSDLAKRFILLEKEIELAGDLTEVNLQVHTAKRLEIESDEPPILRTLDRICHNELCRAMGEPPESYKQIPWLEKRLAQVISFDPPYPQGSNGKNRD